MYCLSTTCRKRTWQWILSNITNTDVIFTTTRTITTTTTLTRMPTSAVACSPSRTSHSCCQPQALRGCPCLQRGRWKIIEDREVELGGVTWTASLGWGSHSAGPSRSTRWIRSPWAAGCQAAGSPSTARQSRREFDNRRRSRTAPSAPRSDSCPPGRRQAQPGWSCGVRR